MAGAWQDPLALIAEKIRSGLRDRETHTYTLETANRSACIKVVPGRGLLNGRGRTRAPRARRAETTPDRNRETGKGKGDAGPGGESATAGEPFLGFFFFFSFERADQFSENHLNTQADLTKLQLQPGNLPRLALTPASASRVSPSGTPESAVWAG